MAEFEVHVSIDGHTRRVGLARSNLARGREIVVFEFADEWLRNHGFLKGNNSGWTLSPAYDLNPVPADLKPRVLSTNIDLDDGTCSIDLLEASAELFALSLPKARNILTEVAQATSTWRAVAENVGAPAREIHRMASSFEHDALRQALALA